MPRPVWTGAISFGMVSIPIRLLPAVKRKSISFNQIDDQTMSRVRYRKISEATGEEVPNEHIVKGYDLGAENYVLVTDDDLAPLQPSKSKEINLESFVLVDEINPLMYDSSYIIVPDKTAKPYALLAAALDGSGRVGIGRFVMRQKEYLAAVRSDGSYLTLSTLVFPDELVAPDAMDGFEPLDDVSVSDKELVMARSLVEALSEDFDPDRYQDEYRLAVEQLIEQKAAGKTPVVAAEPEPERSNVIDLAAALEASLRDAHNARSGHPTARPADDETDAAPAKKQAKKKATKKAPAARTTASAKAASGTSGAAKKAAGKTAAKATSGKAAAAKKPVRKSA